MKEGAFMKRYLPVYRENCIIYWPSFVGSISFLCFEGFTSLIYTMILILFINDGNIAYETIWGIAFASALLLIWLIFATKIAIKSMFCCIAITAEGFSMHNKFKSLDTYVQWADVSRIEFKQESYRGRKQYRVYLKTDKQAQYIAIPISMVNEDRLCSMIPTELLIRRTGDGPLS